MFRMRIKAPIEGSFASCGPWPANSIVDLQQVRKYIHKQGFMGTPIYMATSPYVFDALRSPMPHSDRSYGQFLESNRLIEGIKIIEGDPRTAIFGTYSTKFSDYPDIEVGFCFVEITQIECA